MRWGFIGILAAVLWGCDEVDRRDDGAVGAPGDRSEEIQPVAAPVEEREGDEAGEERSEARDATRPQDFGEPPEPRYHLRGVAEPLPGEDRDAFPDAHPVVDPTMGSAAPGLLGDENTARVAGHVRTGFEYDAEGRRSRMQ